MTRIFLTGASGRTGSRVLGGLCARGAEVVAHARSRPVPSGAVEAIRGDLAALDAGVLRGVETVVHTAGVALAPALAEAARRAGVRRFLAISSTRRFTRFPDAISREVVAAEEALEAIAREGGLSACILRPSMIYGDGDRNLTPVARRIARGKPIPLPTRAGAIQPIRVEDVADATLRALDAWDRVAGRALTVAGPRAISWDEAIGAMGEAVGRRARVVHVPAAALLFAARVSSALPFGPTLHPDQVRRMGEDRTFDLAETRAALAGWAPVDIDEGARRLAREIHGGDASGEAPGASS